MGTAMAAGAATRPAGMPRAVTNRAVLRLALPLTLASLSTPLLGMVDAAVVGRLGDPALLGAIAAAAVVFNVLFWMLGFLRGGTAGLTAQAAGAGDAAEQRAVTGRALLTALALAAAVVVLQGPIGWLAFRLLGASPAVTAAARQYYAIRVWSTPFALLNLVVLGVVVGRGRAGVGLGLQLLVNGSNAALNAVLVLGVGLGVRGSALGTLVSEAAGSAVGLGVLWRLNGGLRVPRTVLLDAAAFGRLAGVNRDLLVRSALLTFAFAFFTARGARGGDVLLAANALLLNLFLATSYFLDGFAGAAGQLCGRALGAGDESGFRRAVRLTALWCGGFAVAAAAAVWVAGGLFVDVASTSAAVRTAAHALLPFAAAATLCGAMAFEFDGVFIGATWTRAMRNLMVLAIAIYLALFVLLRPLGNAGLWLALLGFYVSRGVLAGWRYRGLARNTFAGRTPAW